MLCVGEINLCTQCDFLMLIIFFFAEIKKLCVIIIVSAYKLHVPPPQIFPSLLKKTTCFPSSLKV